MKVNGKLLVKNLKAIQRIMINIDFCTLLSVWNRLSVFTEYTDWEYSDKYCMISAQDF